MGGFGMSGASVSLEAESSRLSQFGRQNNPMFERVQESKQQAFDVYLQQLKQEEQYQQQLKEMEAREKERQKQLVTSIVSAVASSALSIGASAFSTGAENALAQAGAEAGSSLKGWDALSTGFSGGLKNLGALIPGGAKATFQLNDFAQANRLGMSVGAFRGMQSSVGVPGYSPYSPSSYSQGRLITGGNSLINSDSSNGPNPLLPPLNRSYPVDLAGQNPDGYFNPFPNPKLANGGPIFGGSGVRDDVPAMLTGGEFVLNNRATRKLGVQNLNRLNAGETNTGEGDSSAVTESLISKLDELIQATRESAGDNVVVNVSSNEAQAKTENTNGNEKELQRKIKQAVLDVIAQEKRLGGSLTKGK
jgi:hypothetical protein